MSKGTIKSVNEEIARAGRTTDPNCPMAVNKLEANRIRCQGKVIDFFQVPEQGSYAGQ